MNVKVSFKQSGLRACSSCTSLLKHIPKTDTVVDDPNVADVIIGYGVSPTHKSWYEQYPNKRFIFIDLGYWDRGSCRAKGASYKLSLDYWHPDRWLNELCMPDDRFKKSNINLSEQKRGDNILLAGLGTKGSQLYGYEYQSWEREMVSQIRQHTDRPIVYRPKPSDRTAPPIEGTIYRPILSASIEDELTRTHTVVTHHSNVGVEAVQRGIPVYCEEGAPKMYSMDSLADIETAELHLLDREQFFSNLAYFNWAVREMGEASQFYRNLILEYPK